jgi:hypothetical protein
MVENDNEPEKRMKMNFAEDSVVELYEYESSKGFDIFQLKPGCYWSQMLGISSFKAINGHRCRMNIIVVPNQGPMFVCSPVILVGHNFGCNQSTI